MIATVLRNRFAFAPPMLSRLAKHFEGLEHLAAFYKLIDQFLPDRKEELSAMKPADAAAKYVKLFSEKYFPLLQHHDYNTRYYYEGRHSGLKDLTRGISMQWHGMEVQRYEPHNWNHIPAGQLLAETICENPFPRSHVTRIVVLEEFKNKAGDRALELLRLIPENGYPLRNVEWALEDSPWPGLLMWCRYIFLETGNAWMDAQPHQVAWSKPNVKRYARDWPLFQEWDRETKKFSEWLAGNIPAGSEKVIKYIHDRDQARLINVIGVDNRVRVQV